MKQSFINILIDKVQKYVFFNTLQKNKTEMKILRNFNRIVNALSKVSFNNKYEVNAEKFVSVNLSNNI